MLAAVLLAINSVWIFWNYHLLSDTPALAFHLAALYFLVRAMKSRVKVNGYKAYWYGSMCALTSILFRFDQIFLLIIPMLYYLSIREFPSHWHKKALLRYGSSIILGTFIFTLLRYWWLSYIIWNYLPFPTIFKLAFYSFQDSMFNKGRSLYILVETVMSFAILPSLIAIFGAIYFLKKWKSGVYPKANFIPFLSAILFTLSLTLRNYFFGAEQRYVLPLLPYMALYAAYGLTELMKKWRREGNYVAILCILSTYFLPNLITPDYIFVPSADRSFVVIGKVSRIWNMEQIMSTRNEKVLELLLNDTSLNCKGKVYINENYISKAYAAYTGKSTIYTQVIEPERITPEDRIVVIYKKKNFEVPEIYKLLSFKEIPEIGVKVEIYRKIGEDYSRKNG